MREVFEGYFNNNMTAEAKRHHENILKGAKNLANGSINPTSRKISNWYDFWRPTQIGPRNGPVVFEVSPIIFYIS